MIEINHAPIDALAADHYRVYYVDFSAAQEYKSLDRDGHAVWVCKSSPRETGNVFLSTVMRHYQPVWLRR